MDELSKHKEDILTLSNLNYELENTINTLVQDIEYQKKHDPVTGLLNNAALVEFLQTTKNRTYFLMNIDNFSYINFAYGFEFGNEVLIEFTKLLKVLTPPEYTLYRFCADKFILVNEIDNTDEEIGKISNTILAFFNSSDIIIDEISIKVSLSIGVSKSKGIPAISQADYALKELKKNSRNSYNIYKQANENLSVQQEKVYWISIIKESIINEDIIVMYQAILNNKTNKIEKYECLSRIDDHGRLVSPFAFMSAAKATRVLHLLTKNVISTAFKKFSNTEYEFSVNITRDDLHHNYLEEFLLKYCGKYNINPKRVVLEILEDISSLHEDNIIEQLNALRMNGFKIAIDDFGAENSNFSRLLEFSPDYIKIDGAFIKNILSDENSRVITESIVGICKQLKIKSIAEYIHNEEIQIMIKEMGIDYSQGYYIGEPSTDIV